MPRPLAIAVAAVLAVILGALPASADTVCRPTALGDMACYTLVPPPPPRPPFRALRPRPEPVVPPGPPAGPSTRFVPARETRGLGGVITRRPVAGPCRPDQLGNLNCR